MIAGELARRAQELAAARIPFVEATVIAARRPASVRPGASAIVGVDGTIEGFVGGACAEESVRLHALRVIESGESLLLRITPGDAEAAAEEPPAAEGSVTVANPCLSGGTLEIFLEPHLPAPVLIVVGETPIADAIADLGARVGYGVISSPDGKRELGAGEPGSGIAAVVVASHGRHEEAALEAALRAGVPYVALVASPVRGEAVRDALDLPAELRRQLRTPAGLDIGARTPAEVALSILAEIVAVRGEPVASAGDLGAAQSAARSPASPGAGTAVAIDPVCGMEVAIRENAIQLEREGRRHYFCSPACREAFAADPSRYAATR
jgi:xanthine dehydrogenase accessory factor